MGSNALVGMAICFNWTAVGWCVGEVVRANYSDRRCKIDDVVVNYYVRTTRSMTRRRSTCLSLIGGYGKEWVLVQDESAEDAPAAASSDK